MYPLIVKDFQPIPNAANEYLSHSNTANLFIKVLGALVNFQEGQICYFHFSPFPIWSTLKGLNLLL